MKTKRVPFDIEKAKAGAKIITRNKKSVRILDYNLKSIDTPIVAAVMEDTYEHVFKYKINGKNECKSLCEFDLFIEEEIEERYMTYEEVAMWLTEKPYRQYKMDGNTWVYTYIGYYEKDGNEAADNILIREKGGDWHRPLIEEQNQNTLNPLNNEETEK